MKLKADANRYRKALSTIIMLLAMIWFMLTINIKF